MGITDDGIEMRVGSWFNVVTDATMSPDYLYWECNHIAWFVHFDGSMWARVDGGDPGDENDGE